MSLTDGLRVYLVGGAVRDRLLGRQVDERDFVVVGATEQDLLARGFRRVGKDFPVFLHPHTHDEYALARTERKTRPGYQGFAVHADPAVTLEEDLRRRDLTINALADDGEDGLIDPFGGLDDLRNRVLRHVSPAFVEDPVRILRVARFAARLAGLGFTIASETWELMRAMVQEGEVDALVPERVWQEMGRALGEDRPSRFFEVLRECGALARLLPELDRLWGVPQPAHWHPEIDTGVHVMLVIDMAARLSPEIAVRFAALCHDLGKGTTPAAILPSHHGHEERSVILLDQVCDRLRVPRRLREVARITARYHGLVHKVAELRPRTVLNLIEGADALRRPERFEQMLIACEADYRGRTGYAERGYPQAAALRQWREAVAAVDVAAIARSAQETRLIPARIREARLVVLKERMRGG
jgi:tRNA nucleotidyltransferase (CCA-adding enzyme)